MQLTIEIDNKNNKPLEIKDQEIFGKTLEYIPIQLAIRASKPANGHLCN